MVETLFDLIVERGIPSEVLTGLLTRKFKLYGGVVRWAAGTEKAGQIVRHLIPVSTQSITSQVLSPILGNMGVVNAYQMSRQFNALSSVTQQVLQIASGTMVFSGLNLAVTAVGFVVL